jgi:hypothetical protein
LRSESRDLLFEGGTFVSVANDHKLCCGNKGSNLGHCGDEIIESLRRHKPSDGNHERRCRLLATWVKLFVDPWRNHTHAGGGES